MKSQLTKTTRPTLFTTASKTSLICFAAALFIIGAAILIGSAHHINLLNTLDTTSRATIVYSDLKSGRSSDRFKIDYSFIVGGITYNGSDEVSSDSDYYAGEETFVKDYQPGTTIEVKYSAADPARNILVISQQTLAPSIIYTLGGVIFILAAALTMLYSFRRNAREPMFVAIALALGLILLIVGRALETL